MTVERVRNDLAIKRGKVMVSIERQGAAKNFSKR
jgi:hypothetical protein